MTNQEAGAWSVSSTNQTITESGLFKQLTLLDSLPGMAYRCRNTRDWSMLFVSDGCSELSGYCREDLLGGRPHWGDLIHPEDREVVWQSVQESLQSEMPFEVQYRLATRDKDYKCVWERGKAMSSNEHGTLIEGFITDITPLREKELELERSRAFAAAVVESAAEGIVLIDAEFRIESFNSAAAQMFRMASDVAVGKTISVLVSGADFAILESDIDQYRETGTSELFNGGRELTGRRSDGSEFPMHFHLRELRLEDEHRYTVLIRDISEQRAREVEIQQQNERLNATVEFSPVGILMVDKELCIVSANSALANMLGYEVEELIGRRFSELYHPDEISEGEHAVISSLAGGPPHYSTQRRYVHKDGHIVHAALNVAVGHDSDGNPEFIVSNIEDLTERLDVEAQVRNQQDQLTRLDRLSTLGEMMAGVAHEINQPLTAISTYAQSSLRFMDPENPKPDRLREALTKLSDQARRAGAVVERVRKLTRQEDSANEFVSVNHLIKQIEDLATIDARPRGARIRLELDDSLPDVWCDPIQIQQVILNLIRNSVDAMESCEFRHGNQIVLRTSGVEGEAVMISVVDSGPGVSESVARDLFQPFSTHKRSGMGLGLSISRSIVTAHGGQLDYYNNAVAGATFHLTLPRVFGDIK
jgi:two-component system sensor kinase FixL